MNQLIQPFGLRRSGTNLLEHLVLTHFDKDYKLIPYPQNTHKSHTKYGQLESLKHTLPTLSFSDYAIIIFKPYEEWCKSIDRRYGKEYNYDIWEQYHIAAIKLHGFFPDKVIIVDWWDLTNNYKDFVKHISETFNISLEHIKEKPVKKMGTLSGMELLNENFEAQPYKDIDHQDRILIQLNEIKFKP